MSNITDYIKSKIQPKLRKRLTKEIQRKAEQYIDIILGYEGCFGEAWFDMNESSSLNLGYLGMITFMIWISKQYPEITIKYDGPGTYSGINDVYEQISDYFINSKGQTEEEAWRSSGTIVLEFFLSENREGEIRDCISALDYKYQVES